MSRAARTFRLTKKFIKILFLILIFGITAFSIWRAFFSTSEPDSMEALSPNEALASAYAEYGEELYVFEQEQRTITSTDKNYGYFSIIRATFIPSANQVQIVLRYNNSTLRRTQEDFSLDEVPSREGEAYDVSLYVVTDNTPENKDDNLETTPEAVSTLRIHPSYIESDQTNLYNYRLLVFDFGETDLAALVESDALISVFTDIYYVGDVDYEKDAYGTLCLYDYITEKRDAKLSPEDIEAIEAYIAEKK